MAQVLVRFVVMEDGCHIDGSASSTLDFDLRVIDLATEHGWELSTEDAQRVYDARETPDGLDGGDFSVITEIANDACNYLSEVTQYGWHWHITDQSLFLSATSDSECH